MSIPRSLLAGKIFPDRSFSIGFVPKKTKSVVDKQYDRDYYNQPPVDYNALIDLYTGVNTIGGSCCSIRNSPLLVKGVESSQKSRGVYGRSGITKYGKRFCKNACILLEQRYGVSRLGFATATFPNIGKEACRFINGHLSEITRRFYQKIKRLCESRGCEFIYTGCVEIQEGRFRNSGLPVPHLHFVYLAKRGVRTGYNFTTKECYEAWNTSVNEVFTLHGKQPIMGIGGHVGSVKLEPIRSSAAAYLGKYISKGSKVVDSMIEKGFTEFPKQWWTASMQMKKMFKASVVNMHASVANALFYNLERYLNDGQVVWGRFVEIEIRGEYKVMGAIGTLSKEAYDFFSSA